jgi:hypothetical protein
MIMTPCKPLRTLVAAAILSALAVSLATVASVGEAAAPVRG